MFNAYVIQHARYIIGIIGGIHLEYDNNSFFSKHRSALCYTILSIDYERPYKYLINYLVITVYRFPIKNGGRIHHIHNES